jgi:hypothetical protein
VRVHSLQSDSIANFGFTPKRASSKPTRAPYTKKPRASSKPTHAPSTKKPIAGVKPVVVTKAPVQPVAPALPVVLETVAPRAIPIFKPAATSVPIEEQLVMAEPLSQGVIGSRHGEIQTAPPKTGGWKAICPTKEEVCAGLKVCMPRCECFECTIELPAEPNEHTLP